MDHVSNLEGISSMDVQAVVVSNPNSRSKPLDRVLQAIDE